MTALLLSSLQALAAASVTPLRYDLVVVGGNIGILLATALALRGLRTLKIRLDRHQETGIKLAQWLQERPEVDRVLHPALPEHPGHDIWKRDFTGASGLFSIVLKDEFEKERIDAMLDGMDLYAMGASWGGYESLIMPANPAANRTATKWKDQGQLIRIHAGLEDPDDLIEDLQQGFNRLNGNG